KYLRKIKRDADQGPNLRAVYDYLNSENLHSGIAKLYVTHKILHYRQSERSLFMLGGYIPLKCEGNRKSNVCTYMRMRGNKWCIVVVPRFIASASQSQFPVGDFWGKTWLSVPNIVGKKCYNLLTTAE